jgi:methionyl-tRNA formyltransferase
MTDLPYGRGGSPLQNLIVRGHKKTKISALKVEKGLDTGDVYLKKELNLEGSAQKIFDRSTSIVLLMIKEIVEKNMTPVKQTGEATLFKRRTPEMSNIEDVESLNKLYDYIRMLDADGYPKAYLENSSFRFEFSQSELKNDSIEGHVRIIKK